jgi:hypothetical protein
MFSWVFTVLAINYKITIPNFSARSHTVATTTNKGQEKSKRAIPFIKIEEYDLIISGLKFLVTSKYIFGKFLIYFKVKHTGYA